MAYRLAVRALVFGLFLLNLVGALPLNQGSTKADDTTDGGLFEGWSTWDYVWLGLGVFVAVVLLFCCISYLLCECMKEILCLPCTCIKGICGCCCD